MATDPSAAVESVLHLVTPSSQGTPLCGEKSSEAAIGAYCEHVGDDGEWCRGVFGKGGKSGKACAVCLTLYPSLLWGRPRRLEDALRLQTVLSISPYPQSVRDEFSISGFCVSEDFMVEGEPSVIGQYITHGKMALTLLTRVVPKSPEMSRRGGHKALGDGRQLDRLSDYRTVGRGKRR